MPKPCAFVCGDPAQDEHLRSDVKIERKECPDDIYRCPKYRDKYGRHFWTRGYYAETIGQVNEETIRKYIEEQEECSRIEG